MYTKSTRMLHLLNVTSMELFGDIGSLNLLYNFYLYSFIKTYIKKDMVKLKFEED